jgi:hypothetical protein
MVLGEALVVAGAASSAGDPGMGALDDPAPWQDVEPVLARWLGDDLDGDAELAGRPVAPAADVALVGPDVGQAVAAGGAGGLEHERGPGPVLGARGGDHDGDEEPGGVGQDVPLAAVDVLVPVVTAGRGRDDALGRLADRLGAGDPGRRLRAPALRLPDPGPQQVGDHGQGPVGRPAGEQSLG